MKRSPYARELRRAVSVPKGILSSSSFGRVVRAIGARWPWAIAALVFSIITAVALTFRLATLKPPQIGPAAQSSQVLAHDGQVIAELHGEVNRTIIPLNQISPNLRLAVLSAEDRNFFRHKGMSLRSVIRAAGANLIGGGIRQGGSTITQQYVRNVLPEIGRERRVSRKLKEAFWAFQMERFYPKHEIMEGYLNTVYFGRGAYGAEAAARTYFKTSAGKLTLGQSAYLAGLIRAPERFQIDENPKDAVRLRDTVIDGMEGSGLITEAKARAAKRENLVGQFKPGKTLEVGSPRAGYFVEYVRRVLKTEFNLNDQQILRGGLRIHTTLDLRMQDAAEAAVRSTLDRPDDPEAALIAMGSKGEIRAMVGGRNVDSVERARGFNFAADVNESGGGRQAGSAFKPFALAAFLSKGKSLESTFSGESPIEITSQRCRNEDGTPWKVANFEEASFGPVNVTAATLSSVNTVYAQIMNTVVSPADFMRTASRAGIEIPRRDAGCALALGTTDVTPLEMARAYTTFAQRGSRPDPLVITKITRPSGDVVAERFPSVQQALDRNVADAVNYVLEQNIRSGTGKGADIGRPAAGKTGTTQNNQNAWFAGYTPQLTAVVWMGYAPRPDGSIPEMENVRGQAVTGSSFPATIWRKFMSQALKGIPATRFRKPVLGGDIVNLGPSKPSSLLAEAESSPGPSPSPGAESAGEGSGNTAEAPEEDQQSRPESVVPAVARIPSDDDDGETRAARAEPEEERPQETTQVAEPCFPFCD
ncbi:MAG: transglycosylase domain-containing protein [Actinomycetota bacterium]|nr:transglycosylase domain-containing protein [Actinomycetota bacterium]